MWPSVHRISQCKWAETLNKYGVGAVPLPTQGGVVLITQQGSFPLVSCHPERSGKIATVANLLAGLTAADMHHEAWVAELGRQGATNSAPDLRAQAQPVDTWCISAGLKPYCLL